MTDTEFRQEVLKRFGSVLICPVIQFNGPAGGLPGRPPWGYHHEPAVPPPVRQSADTLERSADPIAEPKRARSHTAFSERTT